MSDQPVDRGLTYRWLCRCLSPVSDRSVLLQGLPQTEAECEAVTLLAARHGVLASLYARLRSLDLLNHVPADWVVALEGLGELHDLQADQLRDQMRVTTRLLNDVGVVPVWLKGATRLLEPDDRPRMMLDLDLWIPEPGDQQRALAALRGAGFAPRHEPGEPEHRSPQHFEPLFRDGEPARLEVHHRVVSPVADDLMPGRELLAMTEWRSWGGLRIGVLCARHRLLHSLVQCTVMNPAPRKVGYLPLMKALDFVERYAALTTAEQTACLHACECIAWAAQARRFFSYVQNYFGLSLDIEPDRLFLRRLSLEIDYPRLMYAWFIIEHAAEVLGSGHPGPWRHWAPKLIRHLQTLRQQR